MKPPTLFYSETPVVKHSLTERSSETKQPLREAKMSQVKDIQRAIVQETPSPARLGMTEVIQI